MKYIVLTVLLIFIFGCGEYEDEYEPYYPIYIDYPKPIFSDSTSNYYLASNVAVDTGTEETNRFYRMFRVPTKKTIVPNLSLKDSISIVFDVLMKKKMVILHDSSMILYGDTIHIISHDTTGN